MITRTPSGWRVDIQPGGRGCRRIRKTLATKGEAERFKAWALSQHSKGEPWNPDKPDTRRLSDLCQAWYTLHGHSLKDGGSRLRLLEQLSERLGDPVAVKFTAKDFAHYRQIRLESGVTRNTVNHEHAYLRAVFNELKRVGEWSGGNPVSSLRRLKHKESELSYLADEEVNRLLAALRSSSNPDAYPVALLCLATGARWSEAEGLEARHIQAGCVVFEDTKGGKRRAVPLDRVLLGLLAGRGPGFLFGSCYAAFRSAMKRAGIQTPAGQMSHILRHTFASHFMQKGGNILTLQRVLGHASLTMTMRYAHLAPEHLEEVKERNPLTALYSGLSVDA